jgi:hypothetical protein
VDEGVFRFLYEHRVGRPIPFGTKLPIARLLSRVPELESQLVATKMATSKVVGAWLAVASDATSTWSWLAVTDPTSVLTPRATRELNRIYHTVDDPPDWRAKFSASPRWSGGVQFFESNATFPHVGLGTPTWVKSVGDAIADAWRLYPLVDNTPTHAFDAWFAAPPFESKDIPLPVSLARYALTFYGSCLVRYRPSMVDPVRAPEQAYMFDAVARELAAPMLVNALNGLTGNVHVFLGDSGFRV